MPNLATSIDFLLYALVALTAALIVYKAVHLYAPAMIGRQLGQAPATPGECDEHVEQLESGLAALAVIASASPFVGLGGTVLHIMEALSRMSSGSVDITLISGPIATALNSTLIGLASAVPALVAYNLMQRRIQLVHNRLRRSVQK